MLCRLVVYLSVKSRACCFSLITLGKGTAHVCRFPDKQQEQSVFSVVVIQ